jgi:hypothetical protein
MTRRLVPLAGLLLSALAASTCNWTVFDDLRLQTPVRALSRPDDMDSNTYPTFVLPVPHPRGSAELLVTGTDNVALADFTFGPKGEVGTQTVSSDRFALGSDRVGVLAVAAYLPAADEVPRLAAVTAEDWQPLLITLDSTNASFAVTALGNPLAVSASALATGDTRGSGENDVAIAAGTTLLVLPNAAAAVTQSCDLGTVASALAVGNGQIVAGQSAGDGHAWLVEPPYDQAGADCANVTLFAGHALVAGFGTAVVMADSDGDSQSDQVVVSAPAVMTVYVYGLADVSAPLGEYTVAGGSAACGSSIAVGEVEDRRTLLVGDPGDVAEAGAVWLVDLDTGELLPKLERPNDDVKRFGSQVGVVSFTAAGSAVDLVWVTAEAVTQGDPGVVYLYYWVHQPASDPRAF